jgi:hypothetical protein
MLLIKRKLLILDKMGYMALDSDSGHRRRGQELDHLPMLIASYAYILSFTSPEIYRPIADLSCRVNGQRAGARKLRIEF